MRSQVLRGGIFSAISGLALCLSFPDFSLFPLAWVALVPYVYFLCEKSTWTAVFSSHFLMSMIYFGGVLYWIPPVLMIYGGLNQVLALLTFLLMIVVLSVFLLPFSLLTRWTAERSTRLALLGAPGFWMLTELARNYYTVNGFPWALLGHSQQPYLWLVQMADLSGVYLISALIVAGNCALVAVFRPGSFKPLLGFGVLFLAVNLYGAYRMHLWAPVSKPGIRVALVQPDISLSGDREHYAKKYFDVLPAYYLKASRAKAKWVIFPEAPNPYFYDENFYFRTFWEREVKRAQSFLLFNTTSVEKEPTLRYFNSALLLNPDGKPIYRYDKVHLVPFGEYLPLEAWLGEFFEPLVREVGSFSAGKVLRVGHVMGTGFATLICYEGIFPELSRGFVENGAEVLVNITNDSWYGRTAAPRQHLQIATFRAIETRKPLLRCANSGYSAVIDEYGRIGQKLELFEQGMLMTEIAGNNYRSIYSYIGEWLNIFMTATSVLLALILPLREKKKPASKNERAVLL